MVFVALSCDVSAIFERDIMVVPHAVQCGAKFPNSTSFRIKKLSSIIFVGRLSFRSPKNYEQKKNISAINCRFQGTFCSRNSRARISSVEDNKPLAANISTFHCTVKLP